ncbi:tail fiber domain-containing protein, partial [Brucella abortus]
MGKSSQSAPDPDPNIGKAALKQAETGEEWLAFAKDAFAISQERQKELDALTKRVTE